QIRADKVRHSYRNIPAVSVSLTVQQIDEITKDPWVEHIEYDARVKAAMNSARESFGVDAVRKQFGFTGDGDGVKGNYSKNDIVIAIADSGVNLNNQDLQGKLLFWKDFHGRGANPYDDNGHGTHVAAVALGSGKHKKKLSGVAPEAALVAFKVLDNAGSGSVSNVIAAIDETIARRFELNIRILNLSLAVSGSSAGKDTFSVAANRAVAAGIVVVVAAGNEGPGSATIGAPSAAAKVITVGAGADLGERGFYLADFSSRGPTADGRIKPDIWAPGVRIQTSIATNRFRTVSGTSFATPFVTGVVALMLEANPDLRPAKVKSILLKSAEKWAPGGKSNEAGKGRLRAYEAITRAATIKEGLNPPDVPRVAFLKSTINLNEIKGHTFPVTGLKNFIAITAVLYNSGAGIQMELLAPNGNVVAQNSGFSRHEQLTFKPSVTGVYTLRLTGLGTATPYLLDVSADQN
ncbi:MAG: S8 family serine peptidase, partial [Acidobacteriota bacterium]